MQDRDDLTMHWLRLDDVLAKRVSYAQNHEDILLARAFPEADGLFLDVGANHPVFHSVTKLFSDRGWSGINVEPSPAVFAVLDPARPREVNLNVGVSDRPGTLRFYESTIYHGWSTFRPDLAEHYRAQGVAMAEKAVPVVTLAEICERHVGDRTIDFLKIDAEGYEREILLGGDFARWRPRVLLIENSWPEAWEPALAGLEYTLAGFDGLNRYYVRAEEPGLVPAFASAANVLDNFIPYEYLRLFEAMAVPPRPAGLIDGLRNDGTRVARRLRAAVARLKGADRRAG